MTVWILLLVSSDGYCEKKGIDLYYGNIKTISFTTVQACKEECAKTEGCVAFKTKVNLCYLKNKDHVAESASATAISARMSCYEGNIEPMKGF